MSVISDGTSSVTPILVTGWESTRAGQNVLHNIVGRSDDDVTYRPAGLRSGTLEALCATLELALQLEQLLAQAKRFTLSDPDHPALNMAFVLNGSITVALDDETRTQATVAVEYQQVV